MSDITRKIFNKSPIAAQDLARLVYSKMNKPSWRQPEFVELFNFLRESQWWSEERIRDYQLEQLKKIIGHAYGNVTGYKQSFDKAGIVPDSIKTLADIKKLPFIEKEELRDNLEKFTAANYQKKQLEYLTTGGSTAVPFGFYHLKKFNNTVEAAFMAILMGRVGYAGGAKMVSFTGALSPKTGDKLWRHNPITNWLFFSVYHMADPYLADYVKKIKEFAPEFIHGYPSAITILANYINEGNAAGFPKIKAVFCASENLYDWQRRLFEKAFGCRIFSWYGHAERAVLAGECEHSHDYHIFPEYGLVEVIDKDGNEVSRDGQVGEIVATSFWNLATPFIRYKTRDLAAVAAGKCQCGRNHRLLRRIEGRLQEMAVTKDGRLISMVAINMHSDVFDNVKQFQFYQDKKGEIILNIQKKETYTQRDSGNIQKELLKKFGEEMKIAINFVENIPLTRSGKQRFLIQKLDIEFKD